MAVKDLAAHFGVASATVSSRGKVLLDVLGVSPTGYTHLDLGSPAYLTSARRVAIVADRNRHRAAIEQDR